MENASRRSAQADPDVLARRLMQRAHNRDGLPEIAAGLALLLTGGLNWIQVVCPPGSLGYRVAPLALGIGVPLVILSSQWAIKRMRSRYLIARIGYVEFKPANKKRLGVALAVAIAVAMALPVLILRHALPLDGWFLAGTGIACGILAAIAGRLPRFYVGGLLIAAAGFLAAFSGVQREVGFSLLFGFAGLLALLSGAVVFWRLIHQTAEPGE